MRCIVSQLLPIPDFVNLETITELRSVPYQFVQNQAVKYKAQHNIINVSQNSPRIGLLLVDVQNTFCLPGFELYVGGRSGYAALEDTQRLTQFIYRHLDLFNNITATLDTHQSLMIFHPVFHIGPKGEHPEPYTVISTDHVMRKQWSFNPAAAAALGVTVEQGQAYLEYYVQALEAKGRYPLTIWPYHGMLGGVGHALVPVIEEALFFFSQARGGEVDMQLKGMSSWTEHFSILGPEISCDAQGNEMVGKNQALIEKLLSLDGLVIAGQAKSHCVAWTISDLLEEIKRRRPGFVERVLLLEDCMSSVVVPGVIDYTDEADALFATFADEGMKIVKSDQCIRSYFE